MHRLSSLSKRYDQPDPRRRWKIWRPMTVTSAAHSASHRLDHRHVGPIHQARLELCVHPSQIAPRTSHWQCAAGPIPYPPTLAPLGDGQRKCLARLPARRDLHQQSHSCAVLPREPAYLRADRGQCSPGRPTASSHAKTLHPQGGASTHLA